MVLAASSSFAIVSVPVEVISSRSGQLTLLVGRNMFLLINNSRLCPSDGDLYASQQETPLNINLNGDLSLALSSHNQILSDRPDQTDPSKTCTLLKVVWRCLVSLSQPDNSPNIPPAVLTISQRGHRPGQLEGGAQCVADRRLRNDR